MRRLFACWAILCLSWTCVSWTSVSPGRAQEVEPVGFAIENLEIVTEFGVYGFSVEVARSPEQLMRGLMYRTDLSEDAGMLFDLGRERDIKMWMKDTPIPLDMLFIRGDGRIGAIHQNAEPFSLDTITPGMPVRAVLELNAGTTARLGITAGDRVRHLLFDGAD